MALVGDISALIAGFTERDLRPNVKHGWNYDDIWDDDLPSTPSVFDAPGGSTPLVALGEDESQELEVCKGRWVTNPVANTWHDCTTCRDIIGKGDPYHREAILTRPDNTGDPRGTVVVLKECKKCHTP